MDCTMAYLDSLRNYSHCPPKKRPLAFYNVQDDDGADDQPQDLSVKRRRHDEDESSPRPSSPQVSLSSVPRPHTPPAPRPTTPQPLEHPPTSPPRMPSLADFYLKLFQSTAVQQQQQQSEWWRGSVMWPLMHTAAHPALATHSTLAPHPTLAAHPVLAARLASPQPSEDRLASPRSTASEDSGMGTESLSEDEIDVTSDTEVYRRTAFDAVHDPAAPRGEARYSCTECRKSYSTYSGLSKHKQFHCAALGTKSFACKHCDKVYTSLGALKMHIRTHTLPCKCQLCGKAFSRPWLLQGHIRTHTGEKPFQCSQCDRCFADRSNLRAHLQTHADVKKYACVTCHKTFSRMSLLNKHTEAACPARPHHQEFPPAVPQ
ncbi:zinc finger protein SNAI2-like [Homarus americanus]|uniref:Snail-like 2 n=1 Tax=Homarus americanus TaxID=6706 RepID=A0A8J5JHU1_HOMAM|nr:zinc finger protein SNAI2-like [Homarus americanus]KAG7158567.1 snail-like 2 [Homarus americanus]